MAGRFSIQGVFDARDNFSRVLARVESRAGAAMRRMSAMSSKAASSLGVGASKLSERLGAGVASLSKMGAAAGLAGLAAGLGRVVTVGGNLEQALSSIGAVTGASGKDLDFLKSKVIGLSSQSKFSSLEIAGAFETLAKSGYSMEGALKALPGVLSTAAADGGELQDVVTGLVGTMAGLGLGADKMQLLGDTLAKASDLSSASISTLNESLVKFAPVARQLNIPLADSVAMVSLLQNAGMDAASSGTQLAAVFSKLSAPIGSTQKALSALGVNVKDSFGNLKAPKALFGELLKATSKIQGNAGKLEAFTGLFGLESKTAGLNIAAAAANGQLEQMVAELAKVDGYAQSIADKKTDNLWGDLSKLLNVVDGLAASLFGLQGGGLRGVVQWFTKLVDSNRDLISTNVRGFLEQAKPVVAAFTDAFKGAWPAIEGALGALTSLGGETNWLKTAQEFAVTLGKVTAFAIGAAGAIGTVLVGSLRFAAAQFNFVVEAAESAWGWMIAGIGRVAFTIDDFVMNVGAKWERLKIDAIAGAKALIDGLVNGLTSGAQWVIDAAKNLGTSAIKALKSTLGIRSPSKVFAGLGDQTAAGFGQGFDRSMVAVTKNMTNALAVPKFAVAPELMKPRWKDDVIVPAMQMRERVEGPAARSSRASVGGFASPPVPAGIGTLGRAAAAPAAVSAPRFALSPTMAFSPMMVGPSGQAPDVSRILGVIPGLGTPAPGAAPGEAGAAAAVAGGPHVVPKAVIEPENMAEFARVVAAELARAVKQAPVNVNVSPATAATAERSSRPLPRNPLRMPRSGV